MENAANSSLCSDGCGCLGLALGPQDITGDIHTVDVIPSSLCIELFCTAASVPVWHSQESCCSFYYSSKMSICSWRIQHVMWWYRKADTEATPLYMTRRKPSVDRVYIYNVFIKVRDGRWTLNVCLAVHNISWLWFVCRLARLWWLCQYGLCFWWSEKAKMFIMLLGRK